MGNGVEEGAGVGVRGGGENGRGGTALDDFPLFHYGNFGADAGNDRQIVADKKAWVLLDALNHAFTEPVISAAPGGAGGGGATLTPFGAEVLARYERIATQAADIAGDDIVALSRASEVSRLGSRERVGIRFGGKPVPRGRRGT